MKDVLWQQEQAKMVRRQRSAARELAEDGGLALGHGRDACGVARRQVEAPLKVLALQRLAPLEELKVLEMAQEARMLRAMRSGQVSGCGHPVHGRRDAAGAGQDADQARPREPPLPQAGARRRGARRSPGALKTPAHC